MKNNNFKWIFGVLIVIVLGVIIVLTNKNDGEKIRIGLIMPLTGPAASITDDLQKSVKMYGERAKNIQFVAQDDQCTGTPPYPSIRISGKLTDNDSTTISHPPNSLEKDTSYAVIPLKHSRAL